MSKVEHGLAGRCGQPIIWRKKKKVLARKGKKKG